MRPIEVFEALDPRTAPEFAENLEAQISAGYARDGELLHPLDAIDVWVPAGRSFAVRVHSWDPIGDLLLALDATFREDLFTIVRTFIERWVARFGDRNSAFPPGWSEAAVDPWSDVPVGRRAYRLAYVVECIEFRSLPIASAELAALKSLLADHLELLGDERTFKSGTNHGLYQALGYHAAARRVGRADHAAAALARIDHVIDRHFTDDGVHKEHSPAYQFMVHATLRNATRSIEIASPRLADVMEKSEEALSWLIMPDFRFAAIGDTDRYVVNMPEAFADDVGNDALAYLLSLGQRGRLPPDGVRAFYSGGYGVIRTPFAGNRRAHLVLMAAYHSRVHKHSDDLAIVFNLDGRDVVVDAGKFIYGEFSRVGSDARKAGFRYSGEGRIYCESTQAHSTVDIDNANSNIMTARPYGSGMVARHDADGVQALYSECYRNGAIKHKRIVVSLPEPGCLIVFDWLDDRTGVTHDFRQRFLLAPDIAARRDEGGFVCDLDGRGDDEARTFDVVQFAPLVAAEPVVIGQGAPERLGWICDTATSLVPAPQICFRREGTSRAVFLTAFDFDASRRMTSREFRSNGAGSHVTVRWAKDGETFELEISGASATRQGGRLHRADGFSVQLRRCPRSDRASRSVVR